MAWQPGAGPFGYFDATNPGSVYQDFSSLAGGARWGRGWVQRPGALPRSAMTSGPYQAGAIPGDGGSFGVLDFSGGQGQGVWNEIYAGAATTNLSWQPMGHWGPQGYNGFGELINGIDGPGLGYRSMPSEYALADWGGETRHGWREPHILGRGGMVPNILGIDWGDLGYNMHNDLSGVGFGPGFNGHDAAAMADMAEQAGFEGRFQVAYMFPPSEGYQWL